MAPDVLADDSVFYGLAQNLAQIAEAFGPGGTQVMSKLSDVATRPYWDPDLIQQSGLIEEACTSKASPGTFLYRPLQGELAFRILVVLPGEPSQPLSGMIEHDIVREEGTVPGFYHRDKNYDAISYTWNSDSKPCSILLNGRPKTITQSLFNALNRFRDPVKCRRVWADGICINQEDEKERGAQVALMPLLYTFAAKVLVYLGEQSDGSERVPQLAEAVIKIDKSRLYEAQSDASRMTMLGLPPEDDPSWEALVKLFCRPWFSRIWIIQEVILARNARFFCGDWELGFRQIAELGERFDHCLKNTRFANWDFNFFDAQQGATSVVLMRALQGNRSTTADRLADLEAHIASPSPPSRSKTDLAPEVVTKGNSVIRSYKQHPELFAHLERMVLPLDCIKPPTTSILKLLAFFSQHEASVPQDRLFALVGLARDVTLKDLPPDYEEPEFETNARFSRALVEKGQGMDVLYHATKNRFEWDSGFYPSWSPYWTMKQLVQVRHWMQLGWAYASHPGGFGAPTSPSDAISTVKGEPYLLKIRASFLDSLRGSIAKCC